MPTCLFYFPNTLLEKEDAETAAAMRPAWDAFAYKRSEPAQKTTLFASPEPAPFVPYQWLWMLLTGEKELLGYAPYLRKGMGGALLPHEVWHLAPCQNKDGRLYPAPLPAGEDAECLVADAVGAVLRRHGFQLQTQNGTVFASTKKPLEVSPLPWFAQIGQPAAAPGGADAARWTALSEELKEAAAALTREFSAENAEYKLDGFWVSGGGTEKRFHSPRLFQVLKGGDALMRGIAEASGVARHNIEGIGTVWKHTEPVSRAVIFDEFLKTDRKTDPKGFAEVWRAALQKTEELIGALQSEKDFRFYLVASGSGVLQNLELFPPAGLLGFLSRKKEQLSDWIYL
jgi:hypothetical protein